MRRLALLLWLLPAAAFGQPSASLLKASAAATPERVAPGGGFTLTVTATLQPRYHVNAHVPSEDYLIATELKPVDSPGITLSNLQYPAAEKKKFSFSDKPLAVYEGSFRITAQGAVAKTAALGERQITGTLAFQACNDSQCFTPASVPFRATLTIAVGAAAGSTAGPSEPGKPENSFGGMIGGKGLLATLVFLFLGGLALNLTPCVYPVIPITIGFFGGQAGEGSGRPIGLAVLYVLGMALTYSTLGVLAALSGKLFGSALQSPWVLGGISLVLVGLALSMFGLYDIQPPRFLMNRAGAKTGAGGAFAMGLLVGIVAAPCLGPFVLGLLTYVAARHDPVVGFIDFFVLSLGLGLPYLFLAAFSGALANLPRAGVWMVEVKKIFGFVLLGMAAYFGRILLPEPFRSWLLPAVLVVGGIWILFRAFAPKVPGLARAVTGVAGFLLLSAAAFFVPRREAKAESLAFARYDAASVASAGKPAMIDFSADWCIPCHELEDQTFADARVRKALSGRALFKADLTKQNSPESLALAQKFGILGMPTIVFLDAGGNEIPDSRLVGFEGPEEFLQRLAKLKS
jgi:thiol:disulfide interchange protein DsbD